MTLIVTILLGVLGVIGIAVLLRVMAGASGNRRGRVCGQCKTRNPARAKFCAQCGKPVRER